MIDDEGNFHPDLDQETRPVAEPTPDSPAAEGVLHSRWTLKRLGMLVVFFVVCAHASQGIPILAPWILLLVAIVAILMVTLAVEHVRIEGSTSADDGLVGDQASA